jgi:putative cardiolipin synthase
VGICARKIHRPRGVRGLLAGGLATAALLAGCAGLPPQQNRAASFAMPPDMSTPLGRSVSGGTQEHPGKTGVTLIPDGRIAFGTRMHLARAAARSIDIQTFIWHDDSTGTLLYEEMMQAAQRGVRVRLLLDDANTTPAIDRILALLMQQPNVELRLYNPFVGRGTKVTGFITDFNRLNHRMHNKSFTVDNLVTIVGGRNIADEYFEAGRSTGLVDLDVIATGDAVGAVSAEFDLYWNSASAYPAKTILAKVKPAGAEELAQRAQAVQSSPTAAAFAEAIARTTEVKNLLDGNLDIEWTTARLINDDPAKTLRPSSESELQLLPKLDAAFGSPTAYLDLISPYFVPGKKGSETLEAMARRGVNVRVLTNSLAATDVSSVHAGYSKSREPLLRAGVHLFELKPEASFIKKHAKEIGSSAKAGLHAKTYAVDRRAIFVGSFNLDPRSSKLNTEMGLVIDSTALAGKLAEAIDQAFPDIAYRVTLDGGGHLQWEDGTSGPKLTTEPETSWFRRMGVRIESWLPIEWLL